MGADFARFWGAFFSITHCLILVKGEKSQNEVCDSLGPGDHGCRRYFFQFVVFQKLLTENTMDILLCTDYMIPRIFSQDWDSECSPRFEARLSTQCEPFRLLLLLPCPPASTSPGEGLPRGPLEDLCGRCKRRCIQNRLNVRTFMPASEYEMLVQRQFRKKTPVIPTMPDNVRMLCQRACAVSTLH